MPSFFPCTPKSRLSPTPVNVIFSVCLLLTFPSIASLVQSTTISCLGPIHRLLIHSLPGLNITLGSVTPPFQFILHTGSRGVFLRCQYIHDIPSANSPLQPHTLGVSHMASLSIARVCTWSSYHQASVHLLSTWNTLFSLYQENCCSSFRS